MIDLLNTTFIIPIRIDHVDRYNNAKVVLNYLNNHLRSNVLIYEVSEEGISKLDFLDELTNLDIQIINEKYKGVFHRTRYLNTLLNYAQTPVVCNYDIDVVLSPTTYLAAQNQILQGTVDMLFPYQFGDAQNQIHIEYDKLEFMEHYDLSKIPSHKITYHQGSEFGHCIFYNTQVYKDGGGENENFISWGPEDKERPLRFDRLGYTIDWIPGSIVWHFEHERGVDSSKDNPYIKHNWEILQQISAMDKSQLTEYYKSQKYLLYYDNFLHTQ